MGFLSFTKSSLSQGLAMTCMLRPSQKGHTLDLIGQDAAFVMYPQIT